MTPPPSERIGIKFFRNPQDKSDLFFAFYSGGMVIRQREGRILANNSSLCGEIIKDYGTMKDGKTVSFQVSIEPEVVDSKLVYSVITSNKL